MVIKQKLYLISGLGADKRLFQKLTLPSSLEIIHLEWISPVKNESLSEYAHRLAAPIDTSYPFSLIGLSFGGMIVAELTKTMNPRKAILISSASTKKELPFYYRLIGKLKIVDLLPASFLKFHSPFINWFFGADTKEEKLLLKQIVKDTDRDFLKWALKAITAWTNTLRPKDIYHIHGTSDKVLPSRYAQADYYVESGTHFMVYSQADEISKIIEKHLTA